MLQAELKLNEYYEYCKLDIENVTELLNNRVALKPVGITKEAFIEGLSNGSFRQVSLVSSEATMTVPFGRHVIFQKDKSSHNITGILAFNSVAALEEFFKILPPQTE